MATVRDLVRVAVRAAQGRKAQEVKALDVRGLSPVTDYMIVCTGSSDTNVRAIAEHIREKLAEKGEQPLSVEGLQEGSWVLLDYVDFVVHVFHYEKRLFYGIEELWSDAKTVPVPLLTAASPARKAARAPAAVSPSRPVAKEAQPTVPRAALKPAAKKAAVPKKAAGKRKVAPKKAAVPKRKAQD
jgi:ribosome-associated protein